MRKLRSVLKKKKKIGVVGAGSWGTALAALLAANGEEVQLWAFEKEVVDGINRRHRNPLYMPQAQLPAALKGSDNIEEVVTGADFLVNVVPSHHTRHVWKKAAPHVAQRAVIINAAKGLEVGTKKRLSQVLMETLPKHDPRRFAGISGPSFAKEVLAHLPTTVVVAGRDKKILRTVQKLFHRPWFLVYLNEDLIGVEVGGALKNVIALACGIVEGMGLGHNTRAALITRGLYEMTKLGKALGANPLTFLGLTGLGDLVLTATGELSRNRMVGMRLGKGEKLEKILKEMKNVAEGVETAKSAYELSKKYRLNNVVFEQIYYMLHKGKSPRQALRDLSDIDLSEELGGLL